MLKTAAIILFIAMYVLMVVRTEWRTWVALGTAVLFIDSGSF